jgi:glutamine amidotransferase
MISIIDYGMGNLRSVQKAFEFLGYDAVITSAAYKIDGSSHLVLPGVGAFGDAMAALEKRNLVSIIKKQVEKGKPFLGICLGMQLLFDKSYEHGQFEGLKIVGGEVKKFELPPQYKVPHMGWNRLEVSRGEIFDRENAHQYVYFVHSFYCDPADKTVTAATANYGMDFCAAVARDNVFATQFHPEKSGETGLKMLKKFGEIK